MVQYWTDYTNNYGETENTQYVFLRWWINRVILDATVPCAMKWPENSIAMFTRAIKFTSFINIISGS